MIVYLLGAVSAFCYVMKDFVNFAGTEDEWTDSKLANAGLILRASVVGIGAATIWPILLGILIWEMDHKKTCKRKESN